MALGIGAMFGIFLPVNFLSPYKSTSLVEFCDAGTFHYQGSSKNISTFHLEEIGRQARMLSNLLLTMVIGGLWHGANWTFIFGD